MVISRPIETSLLDNISFAEMTCSLTSCHMKNLLNFYVRTNFTINYDRASSSSGT